MGFDLGLSEIAAISSIAGTGISAIGAMTSSNAAAAQSDYAAQVAANNAVIAQQNARYAMEAGNARATDVAMQNRAKLGATRAALAASGLDVNSGSATDIRESLSRVGQLDTERTLSDAALKAYGYRTQASNFQAQSGLDRLAASNDTTGGFLKAGGLLLSGAGNILGTKWKDLASTDGEIFRESGERI